MSTPDEEPENLPEPKPDTSEDEPAEDTEQREEGPGRFARFTKRILEREDGRGMLSAMWETSDRARMEMVRIAAREVRNYLDALEVKEDLLDLVRSHSLEVHASFSLKPLAPNKKAVEKQAPEPKGQDARTERDD